MITPLALAPRPLFHREAIGNRLIVFILLASSLFTLLATGFQVYTDYRRDVDLIENRMEQIRDSYLEGIANSLWTTDIRQTTVLLEGVVRLPDMRFAEVLSSEGVHLKQGALPETSQVESRFPLRYRDRQEEFDLGELRLVATLEGVHSRLRDRVLIILATQAIKTFLISGFILIIVQFMLTRHLGTMAQFAHAVTPENLHTPLQLHRSRRDDELNDVVVAFNRMRETLQHSYRQLREELELRRQAESELVRYKEQLEEQVEARTEQLQEANENLQEKVRERTQIGEQLQTSLQEKEVLIQEVHHRVKNNMQIISSMIRLQFRQIENEQLEQLIRDLQQRVHTMSLVHEKLYKSPSLSRIDRAGFIRDLARELLHSYNRPPELVKLDLALEPVTLSVDYTIPCGLIINELLTNTLKYAFPAGQQGTIFIRLKTLDDQQVLLSIYDDGPGYPELSDWGKSTTTGLRLIHLLSSQLRGEYQSFNAPGACFELKFREEDV